MSLSTDEQSRVLWSEFREGGSATARERIVESHIPLVRAIASRMRMTAPGRLDLDELVHTGCIGLLNAVDSFDPGRGFAFSTFAVPRIRGAILDDLRKQDRGTRLIRGRMRRIAAAEKALAAKNGSVPTAVETANRLEVDLETMWKWKAQAIRGTAVSLEKHVRYGGHEGPVLGELLAGSTAADIEDEIILNEDKQRLAVFIGELSDRERAVLQLYYYEELKLREIADVMGVTEARISQIRTGVLKKLRERFRESGGPGRRSQKDEAARSNHKPDDTPGP